MKPLAHHFLEPANSTHKQYEALRAIFVEDKSIDEVAGLFGYKPSTLRNLCTEFRKNPHRCFFQVNKPGPKPQTDEPVALRRRRRIIELRKELNLSVNEISERLADEAMAASITTISRILKDEGLPKLWRRTAVQREALRPERAAVSDREKLELGPRRFRTDFGGLFLFAHDLARIDLDGILERSSMPGSGMIPAGCAFRSLLALKLWGIGRPSHVTADTLDEGLALFAGLNVIPKRSTLTEYSCRADPRVTSELMDMWHKRVDSLGVGLGAGRSFDLDFHTIPYHGDDALVEKHYVSKRSRRQKGVLAFLVRDADASVFAYANTNLRKGENNDEILRFVELWRERSGSIPSELIFDSQLTTYGNLAKLEEMGVGFVTLRRRTQKMVSELLAEPREKWRKITLTNVGRVYRTPRILERRIRIKDYPGDIRQIAIIDLGHEKPTLLLTNQMKESAVKLIDRYARRMIIENTISDAVDFFHMDALSSAVPMKVNFDVQLTLMASGLYRVLGNRVGRGFESAEARNIFRKLVRTSARIEITGSEIVVSLGRRTNNPLLISAGYGEMREKIPWLDNKMLIIRFF